MDINHSKSYATRENLMKALVKANFISEGRDPNNLPGIVIVRNSTGRWTAIFSFSMWGAGPAHLGFLTMN